MSEELENSFAVPGSDPATIASGLTVARRDNATTLLTRREVAVAISGAPLVTASAQAFGASLAESIDEVLRTAIARYRIPGVVAAVTDRDHVIYHGAFGFADNMDGRVMREDAIFRIHSMTKPVTSVAAMQLIELGRLGLDDPVEKYLPQFAELKIFDSFDAATGAYRLRPATKSVTVRHLFTHTSGLGYNFLSPIIRDFKPREGESYPVGPLLFEPGQRFFYGPSPEWLARVVATVSGQPFDVYFRERIFTPLRMSDTSYSVPTEKVARLAALHRRELSGEIAKEPKQPAASGEPRGDGGLVSTAADYISFVRMVLNGGSLNGAQILKPESVATMSQNHIGALGVPAQRTAQPQVSSDFSFIADGRDKFGLGFLITVDHAVGKRAAGSLSWAGLANTYFWVDPSNGIGGVILMQFLPFADPGALAVYDAFERAVYRSMT